MEQFEVKSVQKTLLAAQVNSLNTVPIRLVPPSSDSAKAIIPLAVHGYRHYHGNAVFNLEGNGTVVLGDHASDKTYASFPLQDWTTVAASGYFYAMLTYSGFLYPGLGLDLWMHDPAPQDGDGHIMLHVEYKTIISPLKHFVDDEEYVPASALLNQITLLRSQGLW